MSYRAECPECSWTGDASTLSGAGREADEHRQETGHDAKVERDLATDGGVDQEAKRCDVKGCDDLAIARVLPTHGATDHHALRCRDCLLFDLEREWFGEWRSKIEEQRDLATDGGEEVGHGDE